MPYAEKSEVSLEEMVSSLHNVHVAQQASLSDLNTAIESMQGPISLAEREINSVLGEQSILSQELMYLSQDVKRLESNVIVEQSKKIKELTVQKLKNIQKIEKLKDKQKNIDNIKTVKSLNISKYEEKIRKLNSIFVDELDISNINDQIIESEVHLRNIEEENDTNDTAIKLLAGQLNDLEIEKRRLKDLESETKTLVKESKVASNKVYNDQIRMLHNKINKLQQIHAAHKSQLRDLNKIIGSHSLN